MATDYPGTSLTREQLSLFLPNHESIREFERLFRQDIEEGTFIINIISAVGLLPGDGSYVQRSASNYLNASTTIYQDSTILDDEIYTHTREYVLKTTTSLSINAISQTVLCDATAGAVNITLPDPALCFDANRSRKIAVQKIDSTTNSVNILPNGSELVVFEASQVLSYQAEILNFITDGTNWYLQN